MAKKIRDKSKMFSMKKQKREQEHLIFTEFYRLPFIIYEQATNNYLVDKDQIIFITDSSGRNFKLIDIPKSTEKHNDRNLLLTIKDSLNGKKFDTRLKDIVFKSSSLDDNFVSINDNVFLRVLDEDHVKYHMHNTINYSTT